MRINMSDYYTNIMFSYLRTPKVIKSNSADFEDRRNSFKNKQYNTYNSNGKKVDESFAGILLDYLA